jgi:hypothetical protein
MRKSFFEKDLDENNLLILNKDNVLSRNNLLNFNSTIKLFFDFYSKNSSYLSDKNIIYNSFYLKNKQKYDEYYLALNNYNEYTVSYNKTKSTLFSTKTVLENVNNNIVLSQENALKYLSIFV